VSDLFSAYLFIVLTFPYERNIHVANYCIASMFQIQYIQTKPVCATEKGRRKIEREKLKRVMRKHIMKSKSKNAKTKVKNIKQKQKTVVTKVKTNLLSLFQLSE
jgi:hypothetical protein